MLLAPGDHAVCHPSWAHLGVIDGLAENTSGEGGDVKDGPQGHAAAVLKPRDALKCYLLRDDVDVRKTPLLLHTASAPSHTASTQTTISAQVLRYLHKH